MKKYKLVVAGGTFDHFHKGHREFLKFTLSLSDRVLLGISSNSFAQKRKGELEDFETRKKAVLDFLTDEKSLRRATTQSIDSVYVPNEWENLPIEAIVTTDETKRGADEINNKRLENGQVKLPIEVFPFVLGEDGNPISSKRIRSGEINRDGRVWIQPSWFNHSFLLPEDLREELKKPFGELYKTDKDLHVVDGAKSITVGDIVTQTFNKRNFSQRISVVDFIVRREKKFSELHELGFKSGFEIVRVTNSPGTITPQLFKAILNIFNGRIGKQYVLVVNGEEDLAVLPLLLRAPLGYRIFYGQPGQGIIRVDVTEKSKNRGLMLLNKFHSSTRGY